MTRRLGQGRRSFRWDEQRRGDGDCGKKGCEKMKKGTIVVMFPDSGERYLSTPLFEQKKKADLFLFNTVTRSKQPFEPISAWSGVCLFLWSDRGFPDEY
jgi:hypothetical protein